MTALKSVSQQAEDFLADPRFNQTITIPSGSDHDQLTVSYADYGHITENDSQVGDLSGSTEIPVVLFIPGMYASRYLGHLMHFFAKKHRVRLLVVDRFGFGRTPEVVVEKRVQIWVSILPKFLQALGVKYVTLMSHSAGTIYSINTLWHCRQFLHPKHPQAVFFAPWVDSAQSSASLVMGARVLPSSILNGWGKLSNLVVAHTLPSIGASSGILSNLVSSLSSPQKPDLAPDSPQRILEQEYGLEISLQEQISTLAMRKMLCENTEGSATELMLCLKKGPVGSWGDAEDMNKLVERIADRERASRFVDQEKLDIRIIFPESDFLSGSAGQQFFKSCWVREGGEFDDCLDVTTKVIEGRGHDDVIMKISVLKEIFERIGSRT